MIKDGEIQLDKQIEYKKTDFYETFLNKLSKTRFNYFSNKWISVSKLGKFESFGEEIFKKNQLRSTRSWVSSLKVEVFIFEKKDIIDNIKNFKIVENIEAQISNKKNWREKHEKTASKLLIVIFLYSKFFSNLLFQLNFIINFKFILLNKYSLIKNIFLFIFAIKIIFYLYKKIKFYRKLIKN